MPGNSPVDIQKLIESAREQYPTLWRKMITEWRADGQENAAWLVYAANYLFRTASVRWAIDPFALSSRVRGVVAPDFLHDLAPLELVLLTHAHNDHLDLNLIRAIATLPIRWLVPDFMLEKVLTAGVPRSNILVPQVGVPVRYNALEITPFAGQHIRSKDGVPEIGYLVSCEGRRWAFPGDTRVYDDNLFPRFGRVDALFAHLWLGKAQASAEPPPLLKELCDFVTAQQPERIVVTHLYELGRDEDDLWHRGHYAQVEKVIRASHPAIKVEMAVTGTKVVL